MIIDILHDKINSLLNFAPVVVENGEMTRISNWYSFPFWVPAKICADDLPMAFVTSKFHNSIYTDTHR